MSSSTLPQGPRDRPELALAKDKPAPSTSDGEETLDFRRWANGVIKRWWVVAIATVVVTVAGAVYTIQQPKLFAGSTTILIERNTPNVLSGVDEVVPVSGGGWWAGQDFYHNAYLVLKSREVAGRAALNLGPEFFEEGIPKDPSELLFGKYELQPDKNAPGVVKVRVVDTNAARAAKIATAIARAFEAINLEQRVQGTKDAGTWLSLQHRELKKKLEDSEDALYQFMRDNDVLNASLQTQLDEVGQRLQAFNAQLATVQAERIRSRVDAEALRETQTDRSVIGTLEKIQGATLITGLKTRLTEARAQRSELSTRYQDKHPKMVALNDQINALNAELTEEINAHIVALERGQRGLAESERGLRVAIAQEREREARLNTLQLDYKRLERDVKTNEKLYAMVTSRMKETDLSGAMRFNNVSVLDEAREAKAPFAPNMKRQTMMAFLLGLFLGIAIALLLEALDNTIKSHADVEVGLGIPFLGLIPVIDSVEPQRRDLYVLENPKSQPAECVRFVRTNLMFMGSERKLHTLTVTSARPQEGKTTTAISLAVTMAQAGNKTLLVDTDMRRPRIHKTFGFKKTKGLTSVLLGEIPLEDAVSSTDNENLEVLICGQTPPNPSEILHTRRFAEFVEQLKEKYDRIVFDSSPVGAVTDPVILSQLTDGTVLVLRSEETTKESAKSAKRALADANVRLLGAVLNTVDLQSNRYGGYSYQYYSGYGEDEET